MRIFATSAGWAGSPRRRHASALLIAPRAVGDLAAAWAAYQVGLDIAARLAAADQANARWQRDLAWVRRRIADLPPTEPS